MTERLYHSDAYLTEFEATALSIEGNALYLDRTAFYPTSGGQQHDVGTLELSSGNFPVVDVREAGERIAHVLGVDRPLEVEAGVKVRGRVEFARRFDHMQQHTGQHLLSAVFQERLGFGTASVHFGAEVSTLELGAPALTSEQVRAVEAAANQRVFENRPVVAGWEATAEGVRARLPSEHEGPLRIVEIQGLDRSACCGTHVQRTGEIGVILLGKQERVRKNVRIEFVCGARALRRARTEHEIAAALAMRLGTSVDGALGAAEQRFSDLERHISERRKLEEQLDAYRARELYEEARSRRSSPDQLVLRVERRPAGSLQELRGLAVQYSRLERAALLVALDDPPALLLATSEDSGFDAGALMKAALARSRGRGGGSSRVAQGSLESTGALETALGWLALQLSKPVR